jgi:curved DNA-binding protein CbpA
MPTHYEILGLRENASAEEIHCAYRRLAKKHHPDMKSGDAEKFKLIMESYNVLFDSRSRAKYDLELRANNKTAFRNDIVSVALKEYLDSALSGVLLIYSGVFGFIAATTAGEYRIIFLLFMMLSATIGLWFLKK